MQTPAQHEKVTRVAAMAAEIRARRDAGLPAWPTPPARVSQRLDELAEQIAALEQLAVVLARSQDPTTRARVDAMYDAIEKMVDAADMRPPPQRRHLRVVRDEAS